MRLFEYRSVRYWSKEINGDTYWGPKKLIFLIRDIDDATMAAASLHSSRRPVRSVAGVASVGTVS